MEFEIEQIRGVSRLRGVDASLGHDWEGWFSFDCVYREDCEFLRSLATMCTRIEGIFPDRHEDLFVTPSFELRPTFAFPEPSLAQFSRDFDAEE